MSDLETLKAQAANWLSQDPDPETRVELEKIVSASDIDGLRDRFGTRLSFGTAGLRGELGAGPNRMNRVLVAQAAAGLGRYLKANFEQPSCVIGFDARKNSDVFAKDSAELMAAMGIKVYLFDSLAATPLVAFAVRELGCSAGVMVTASHNPPADNGYKVYDHTGSQIIKPVDSEIAKQIDLVANSQLVSELSRSSEYLLVPTSVRQSYLKVVSGLISSSSTRKQLKMVYSAMHGVGANFIEEIFKLAGFDAVHHVAKQQQPDGSFPTVKFPNPEEPGAMDLSLEEAAKLEADLVLVNDPDADRLAVAYRSKEEGFIQLTGDQLGLLLGEEMAKRAKAAGVRGALGCSMVSSSMLEKVAQFYGMSFSQTLTGFKWIARVPNLIFGYEEALGYCVDWQHVRDKDGLSAAIMVADIATSLAKEEKTLGDQLDELYKRYGYHSTGQISIRVTDLSEIKRLMDRLRTRPPAAIAGQSAIMSDLSLGSNELPATDAIRFDLEDGRRVIVRPSGTEPKLKCYLQAVGADKEDSMQLLADLRSAMQQELN